MLVVKQSFCSMWASGFGTLVLVSWASVACRGSHLGCACCVLREIQDCW